MSQYDLATFDGISREQPPSIGSSFCTCAKASVIPERGCGLCNDLIRPLIG
jgi:hypothetical protein